jgi:uncharacterized protein YbjT (DUF2867 family)
MILITGAGGKTGRALIKSLSQVEGVSAFIRREEQAAIVKSLGAEKVIVGDLRDEAAVRSAFQNVRAVYHICPNMSPDEVRIGKLVLDAARERRVEHFVYHSVLHPQTEKMLHHWQKLRVEEMIFEAGLAFTILQPAPYMQNLLAGWKSIAEDGLLRVPYSVHSKFSFIDLEDLAAAAKLLMTGPDHLNAVYELAGTFPMSHQEVANVYSQVLRREVLAQEEEIGAWRLRVERMGTSRYAVENLIRMFQYYDRWGLVGNPRVLSWLLEREPTTLEAFVGRCAQESAG